MVSALLDEVWETVLAACLPDECFNVSPCHGTNGYAYLLVSLQSEDGIDDGGDDGAS